MLSSGNVRVYVSNMDRAVRFYTGMPGLDIGLELLFRRP